MIENISLPQDLIFAIGSETKDFAVKAKRKESFSTALSRLVVAIFWLAISVPLALSFSVDLNRINFASNEFLTVASFGDLFHALFPSLFVLIGIGILGWSIFSLFGKGGYFVGTPTRLVSYRKGKIRSVDWKQFSGDIKVSGNTENGNIHLQLITGRMVSSNHDRRYGPPQQRYVPDVIHMIGIPNALEIERICRKRMDENTP
ncbi:hypothetical protein [Methanolobus psychrotolerans]|uniref:hypothetical protein n=1 Tax=Methanolobus psychrotolerans TaxID=1874706 RepID=UPI000B91A91A|nr:hypothetical protein [Methanolobus psychrotolerans]